MEVKVIDADEYLKFALKSPYISIYQLPEWGTLKSGTGWKRHLVGLYNNKKLMGVTMLLEKTTPLKKSLFYSPRGYLVDVYNFSLLKEFHQGVIKYVKSCGGFMLKIDPNVIYAIRDQFGDLINDDGKQAYFNFKKLGFKHLGFTQDFEGLQPRNLCRFKLHSTYEDTLNSFSKSTIKNINKTWDMGVRVKTVNSNEIELFCSLLEDTANKKDFIIRPASYYKRQVELMKDYTKLYVSYIDTNIYYDYVNSNLENVKKEIEELEAQMKKINVGAKMRKKQSDLESKCKRLEKELDDAKRLKGIGKQINIGALMSLFIGNESVTFMSGTKAEYKEFNPKYAFYNEHIKESIKLGKEYVNFYGISGNLDKNGPYYGIYEIKKGFNPEIVELIGEFDYILNPFVYHIYNIALKFYKLLKKIK